MIQSSLLRKAIVMVVLVFGLTLVAVTASSAWRIDGNMTRQSESRGAAIANGLASSGVEVLLFRDVATIQSMIDQHLEIEGVGYVVVVTPKGDVLAHTFAPHIPPEVRDLKVSRRAPTVQPVSIADLGDFIDVSSPILDGEMGHVHVGMDRRPIRAAIWAAIGNHLLVIAAIFLFSLLAAALLMDKIVRPLGKLTDYAKTLAADGSTAQSDTPARHEIMSISHRPDEVGQLAGAFRYMVDRLSGREKELREAHRDLEQRVRERTAELTAANDSLQQKTNELERFNRLAVSREQRMIELKRQVNELAHTLGRPAPYDLSFVNALGGQEPP
jgi:methyl-accepting chemotaxis protein